tara:strand:+ start:1621 stop:1932 length:312 start_codon:yes stop_codon:yes gene_type:complete
MSKYTDKLIADVQMDIRYKELPYKVVGKKYNLSPNQVNYILSLKTKAPLASYVPVKKGKVHDVSVTLRSTSNLKKVITGNSVSQTKKSPLSFFDWLYKWFGSK